ncbi:lanthionine synthetase C family protein [Streptomyces pathocidini]|uniref:lanthionine synthetase C family protein n=1 Tax=Streptomyces pathocidini TaxID=1650571 RepID=UPI0033F77DFD
MTEQTTDSVLSRKQAGQIVAEVAEQLSDPDSVAAAASTPGNLDRYPGRPAPVHPWAPLTLAEGHPGVALLYAELARTEPGHRIALHSHLAKAARHLSTPHHSGLFTGAASLAFAARLGRRHSDDYAQLLDRIDERVTASLRSHLADEEARLNAGVAGVRMSAYDTIAGVSGIGRYLLLRHPRHRDGLLALLSYLVRLTHPVTVHGHTVPGWWVPTRPDTGVGHRFDRGHFNLGLAHGICGPLALLALGREAGVTVPGQDEAMARIVDHLLTTRIAGGGWPRAIGFDELVDNTGTPHANAPKAAWCYGTPGAARALYLAGRALSRDDWQHIATQALVDALTARPSQITDSSLCHGWAGLLHIAWRMAHDSADRRLTDLLPQLVAPLLTAYDSALPFGFAYTHPYLPPDQQIAPHRPSFLEGAAGIALALHTYATDGRTPPAWDAALLLS